MRFASSLFLFGKVGLAALHLSTSLLLLERRVPVFTQLCKKKVFPKEYCNFVILQELSHDSCTGLAAMLDLWKTFTFRGSSEGVIVTDRIIERSSNANFVQERIILQSSRNSQGRVARCKTLEMNQKMF